MAIPILNHMDFQKSAEIRNVLLHATNTAGVSSPGTGQIIYDSGSVKYYNGSSWLTLASGGGTRTVGVDTSGNGSVDNTLELSEDLVLKKGTGVTLSEAGGVVTISANSTLTQEQVEDYVGGMLDGTETGISVSYDDTDGNLDFVLDAAQTSITSVVNAALEIGRDADNRIKFGTDNQIIFEVDGGDNVIFKTSGEIEASSLDISGSIDIDGTANLDAVDIDGAVQIDGATTFGVDDTGVDVKFFGATASAYLLWDESADKLLTAGGAVIDIVKDKLLIGGTAVTTTAAELNILDGKAFLDEDNMATDSATGIASQQSIKAYVDGKTYDDCSVANLKTRLAGGFASNAVQIGDSNDTVTIPGNLIVTGTQTISSETVKVVENNTIEFEGTTADAHEIKLTGGDPTADRTVALPDASGTIALTSNSHFQVTKLLQGDGSTTAFVISHGLGSNIVSTKVLDYGDGGSGATYEEVIVETKAGVDTNKVALTFASAPSTTQDYLVLVTKFPAAS